MSDQWRCLEYWRQHPITSSPFVCLLHIKNNRNVAESLHMHKYISYKQVCIKDVHAQSTITSEHRTRHAWQGGEMASHHTATIPTSVVKTGIS